jgi:SAM-dependent methyltransferase
MGFRRRLLEIPAVYDTVLNAVYQPGKRNLFVSELIEANINMRVLDVGCGTADILKRLPLVEYVGIDSNQDYLDVARSRYGSRGTFKTLDVLGKECSELGKFDRILLLGVLHHLTDSECSELLGSLASALSFDGFLVTLDPALEDNQHPISWMISKLDRGRHVRHHIKYYELISEHFEIRTSHLKHDFLRLPSTTALHKASMRMQKI